MSWSAERSTKRGGEATDSRLNSYFDSTGYDNFQSLYCTHKHIQTADHVQWDAFWALGPAFCLTLSILLLMLPLILTHPFKTRAIVCGNTCVVEKTWAMKFEIERRRRRKKKNEKRDGFWMKGLDLFAWILWRWFVIFLLSASLYWEFPSSFWWIGLNPREREFILPNLKS